jgi:hypothetical protein
VVLELLDAYHKYERNGRNPLSQSVSFQLPETVVNDYLQYSLKKAPRPGIRSATVNFLPDNLVSVLLSLDFDSVERWTPGLIPASLRSVLTADTLIRADIVFQVHDGVLTFTLKQAHAPERGLSVKELMENVIPLLAAHQPEKYDASKPIPLPFGIRKIWTEEKVLAGAT